MSNERFQNAIQRKSQPTPPVWMMRQAGRYHKHYQALRQKYSFMQLCKEPELAAETALGPIEDFDFDVAILFSDLLFPLEALGMGLKYDPSPTLAWQLNLKTVKNLTSHDNAVEQLMFQKHALKATRELLPKDKSLIGFVGGPWTLFTYAVEGAHKGSLIHAKSTPGLYAQFCERMLPLLKANIALQLEGGAEVVMIFDTAAGEVSARSFQLESKPLLNSLAEHFPGRLGYYAKGVVSEHYVGLSPHFAGFGFDHRFPITERLKTAKTGFVQGNFDQALLFADDLKPYLTQYLEPIQRSLLSERNGWVCGLGHGILPQTPEKNVRLFVETIREIFR